jgi:cytochrome P450 family 307 subfamily A
MLTLLSVCLLLLATGLLLALVLASRPRRKAAAKAPGPRPWPVIGSLHLLGGHETPFHAFTSLAKRFGAVYQMQLGTSRCVVVNTFPLIKEVLITKGVHFGGRPDFIRFHQLFGGDRDNCEYNLF